MNNDLTENSPEQMARQMEEAIRERKSLRGSVFALAAILALLCILLAVVVNALSSKFPRQEFVYTLNAAAVCSSTPVNERGEISDAVLKQIALDVVKDLHALDPVNWRETLNRVTSIWFTVRSRDQAVETLRSSGILGVVTQQRFIMRLTEDDAPTIMQEGVVNGVYTWRMRMPVTIVYVAQNGREVSGASFRPEKRIIDLTISRTQPSPLNQFGILVTGLVSTQAGADASQQQDQQ